MGGHTQEEIENDDEVDEEAGPYGSSSYGDDEFRRPCHGSGSY
jgi:hypothetical protein